jgi:hypothetical protein
VPNKTLPDSNVTKPDQNASNATAPNITDNATVPSNITKNETKNETIVPLEPEPELPKPYVPTASCMIYGVERYKDNLCTVLDTQLPYSIEKSAQLNDMVNNDTCVERA